MRPQLWQQIRRFSLNGVAVTLLDFILLNILVAIGIGVLLANIVSVTIAVLVSYQINKKWVFGSEASTQTFISFVGVTLIGSYLIQTIILFGFHQLGQGVGILGAGVVNYFGFAVTAEFMLLNISKAVATVGTAAWNFVLYKKVVFRAKDSITTS